jgi:diacylglycerol kinase (ATP)
VCLVAAVFGDGSHIQRAGWCAGKLIVAGFRGTQGFTRRGSNSSRLAVGRFKESGVRACVIFNPYAKGQKAGRFRQLLATISQSTDLKHTTGAGDARRLAALAVNEDYDTVFAAGGDGTVNEVLNGIAAVDGGLSRTRLGVLPLGTINVFARELRVPSDPAAAWRALQAGGERAIDLPYLESAAGDKRHYFAQLAGAGLDARAIELTSWSLKKRIGPLAYIVAGLKAMMQTQPEITVTSAGGKAAGGLVLVGNGSLYGGSYQIFPESKLDDGLLEVCVFPRVNWMVLLHCGTSILLRGRLPESRVRRLRGDAFDLVAKDRTGFEVDGEWAGALPARVCVLRGGLRVLAP